MAAALVASIDRLLAAAPSATANPDKTLLLAKAAEAQAIVERECGRAIGLDARVERHSGAKAAGRDKTHLYLAAFPVDATQTVTVSEDGSQLSVSDDPATSPDVLLLADRGVLVRAGGWSDATPANILVSYVGGYDEDTAPADLSFLVTAVAWRLYQLRATLGVKTAGRGGGTATWDNALTPMESAALWGCRASLRPRTLA
ncbi:MAG: hypothetical protein ABFD84_11220 [Candidatus Polarisedimenticolia bacterium]|nr:hypothetical protein [bacterium]